MECKAQIHDISLDFKTGKQIISLACEKDISEEYERLKDKECKLKLVQYRKRRSLDANAYFHVLVWKIAETINRSKIYTKNRLIAEYGQMEIIDCKPMVLTLSDDIEPYDIESIHLQPTTRTMLNSKGNMFRVCMVMRGSHTYNTKEMSILIDGAVQEAKQLGIETATPQELKEMQEKWRVEFEKAN